MSFVQGYLGEHRSGKCPCCVSSGLPNFSGYNCYFNSALQMLINNGDIMAEISKNRDKKDEFGKPCELLFQVFHRRSVNDVRNLFDYCCSIKAAYRKEWDPYQVLSVFFQHLANKLKIDIPSLMWKFEKRYRCGCHKNKFGKEEFRSSVLSVFPKWSTSSIFSGLSVVKEFELNQCKDCLMTITQENVIVEPPPYAFIRFDRTKTSDFNQEVDLDETMTIGGRLYELWGGIEHRGRSNEYGHYVSMKRKGRKWLLFNDSEVSEMSSRSSFPSLMDYDNYYWNAGGYSSSSYQRDKRMMIVVYRRVSYEGHGHNIPSLFPTKTKSSSSPIPTTNNNIVPPPPKTSTKTKKKQSTGGDSGDDDSLTKTKKKGKPSSKIQSLLMDREGVLPTLETQKKRHDLIMQLLLVQQSHWEKVVGEKDDEIQTLTNQIQTNEKEKKEKELLVAEYEKKVSTYQEILKNKHAAAAAEEEEKKKKAAQKRMMSTASSRIANVRRGRNRNISSSSSVSSKKKQQPTRSSNVLRQKDRGKAEGHFKNLKEKKKEEAEKRYFLAELKKSEEEERKKNIKVIKPEDFKYEAQRYVISRHATENIIRRIPLYFELENVVYGLGLYEEDKKAVKKFMIKYLHSRLFFLRKRILTESIKHGECDPKLSEVFERLLKKYNKLVGKK